MGQRANVRLRSDEMMERANPQSMALPNPSLLQPAIGVLSHSPHSFLALQVSKRMLSIPDLHLSHCIPAEKQSYSPPEALLRLPEYSAAFPKAHFLTFPRFNELDGKTGAIRSPDNDKQLAFSAENQRLKRFHQMYAQKPQTVSVQRDSARSVCCFESAPERNSTVPEGDGAGVDERRQHRSTSAYGPLGCALRLACGQLLGHVPRFEHFELNGVRCAIERPQVDSIFLGYILVAFVERKQLHRRIAALEVYRIHPDHRGNGCPR